MRNRVSGGIYVVEAMRNGAVQYWAAATLRQNAVAAVVEKLGPEWVVTLTKRRLTNQRLSILKMRPNTVRKL
jgi:hypothetical protein